MASAEIGYSNLTQRVLRDRGSRKERRNPQEFAVETRLSAPASKIGLRVQIPRFVRDNNSFVFFNNALDFVLLLQPRDHAEIFQRRGIALHVTAAG